MVRCGVTVIRERMKKARVKVLQCMADASIAEGIITSGIAHIFNKKA